MTWLRAGVVPLSAWLTALILVGAAARTSAALAVAATIAGAVVGWRWLVGHHRGRDSLLLMVAAAVAAVAVSSAARADALTAAPWPKWADQRAEVSVLLTLVQTPRISVDERWTDTEGATAQATRGVVVQAEDGISSWRTDTPVYVSIPGGFVSEPLRRGDRLSGTARVGRGDQRSGLAARLVMTGVAEVTPAGGLSGAVDRRFREALADVETNRAALVQGLAMGEDAALGEQAREAIQVAGLSHLTAVSGANIAMVVGVVMWAARIAGLSRLAAVAPAAVAMAGYVGLVGPEPSVVRAATMAAVVLIAIVVGGGSGIAALSSAITVLLVWNPGLAVSRGFALSCAATGGLIAAAPSGRRLLIRLLERLPGWSRVPTTIMVVAFTAALAAGVATAPLLASYGEGVSWAAIVANVLVAPVVPLVTIGGLLVAGVAMASTSLAASVAVLPAAAAAWILRVAMWAEDLPGGRIPLPGTWQVGLIVAFVLVVVLGLGRRWPRLPAMVALSAVVAAVAQATMPAFWSATPSQWAVLFCDVGQGDATLLRSGPESAVLVDAGPEPGAAVDCIARAGIATIDAVLLTHFHRDHVEGFGEVAQRHAPGQVWVSPLPEPQLQAAEVDSAARSTGVRRLVPAPGTRAAWGWASVEVLAPSRVMSAGSAPNNSSLVITAEVQTPSGEVRVLLAGDVEPEAQSAVMAAVSDPQVSVAKVPHHGSANQHPRFATWTRAQWAVISCGQGNDYGHPAPSTAQSWRSTGAAVLRTDLHGDIYVASQSDAQVLAYTSRKVEGADGLAGAG